MRPHASVLHIDLDAFFAAVEQRDKPSLRGKPVVVGGVGGRGVVATASYEARSYGVRSAMSTREARGRCPHAAYLSGRFSAYRATSHTVMRVLREISPLVEPLSLDEAFVDLAASTHPDLPDLDVATVHRFAEQLRARVREVTGGLSASVGIATSKFVAKVASELDKPDGLVVVSPGTELDLLRPMSVTAIPGVGPATTERLRRVGVTTVAQLEQLSEEELIRLVGNAHGKGLHELAHAIDNRPVVAERDTKSVSVEHTYDTDLTDHTLMNAALARQAVAVAKRLSTAGLSGRTVTLKVRMHDFTTLSRSTTLPSPTDHAPTITTQAQRLLATLDVSAGVRLLGVGVSGLADWVQDELFADSQAPPLGAPETGPGATDVPRKWAPGADVVHDELGRGWVWGSGRAVVTVRFETADSPPGPVRSFSVDDPRLRLAPALCDDENAALARPAAEDGAAPPAPAAHPTGNLGEPARPGHG